MAPNQSGDTATNPSEGLQYRVVTSVFMQDDPLTDQSTFDYTANNFGLRNIDYTAEDTLDDAQSKTQWQKFTHHVDRLNRNSLPHLSYKVLFLARHGEGFHNVAESKYGTEAWDSYWSRLDGNGEVRWADALLTPKGVEQALHANKFWKSLLEDQRAPAPQSYYTSPLTRCLQTANYTFAGLSVPSDRPFLPLIKEKLREDISPHTCDRRSAKSHILGLFPGWQVEPGFTEMDELWSAKHGETAEELMMRCKHVLDDIFNSDSNTWISITSHSGFIAALLTVLGHRVFGLETGQALPVLIEARQMPLPRD